MNTIGIRHEDKYELERRAPLTPHHITKILKKHDIEFSIENSAKRIFKNEEYELAGVNVVDKVDNADIVLGVKEMPIDFFQDNKTYIFFSHVIKGQSYNMPMLKKMMEKKCTLIDYEKIADNDNRRLIFFGRYAGLAGMINSLWSFGVRMEKEGITTRFSRIKQARHYNSLEDAKEVILQIGKEIREFGMPEEIVPFTIGVTGYGNVSKGAQEIIDLLPVEEISPEQLQELKDADRVSNKLIYKIVFKESDISRPKDEMIDFNLDLYYKHPELFENNFEQYVPHLSILMNCMYWDDNYPRIVTKEYLKSLFEKEEEPKLKVIGDITCDPNGSIECTHIGTMIEDPVFVYNPIKQEPTMGFDGDGILVMSVDILPSELPRDASESFGDALMDFIPQIAKQDFSVAFDKLELPSAIRKAIILHKGELTESFEYITEYM